MDATWQNVLRKFWRMIENETETLLSNNCIKDNMLYNDRFKDDFLQVANDRIATTYERFLNEEKLFRTRFNVDSNQQQDQNNSTNSPVDSNGASEVGDTSTHSLDHTISNNATDGMNQRSPSFDALSSSMSNTSISQNKTSNTQESKIIQNNGQENSTSEEGLGVSHELTLADLNDIVTNYKPQNTNKQSHGEWQQMTMVLGKCLSKKDIELTMSAMCDDNNLCANAKSDGSQTNGLVKKTVIVKPEQDSVSSSPTSSDNKAGDSTASDTACTNKINDLTSNPDQRPLAQQQTTKSILNVSSVSRAKKRKHVSFEDAEISGKKQKHDDTAKQSDIDSRSSSKVNKENSNLSIDIGADSGDEVHLYKCTFCAREFNRNTKLEAHVKSAHKEDVMHQMIPFQCSNCKRRFTAESDWKSHEKQCKSRRYECYLCGKSRGSKALLLEHMTVHTGEKPSLRCSECTKCYRTEGSFMSHFRKVHKKNKAAAASAVAAAALIVEQNKKKRV